MKLFEMSSYNLKQALKIGYPFSYANFFIPEFIARMRRSREVVEKPSPRQSINMGKVLLTWYLNKGCIKLEDLARVAIITSTVDNQKLAEKIALDIMLNIAEEEKGYDEINTDMLLSLLSKKSEEPYITPHAKGLEQSIVNESPSIIGPDQFLKTSNNPDTGVGPGEDRIIKYGAKLFRDERDEKTRKLLAYLIKDRLLKLGREVERKDDWSRITLVRPFQPGEDPNDIDEDRSIENIVDLGRKVDEVRHDDFMMLKRKKKNRSIVYIQDISNTMFYDLEGINSVNYSIMSLIPLMWGLRYNKWGLIFYESNSHVIKELSEEKDIELILEGLLDMTTMTTMQMEHRFRGTVDGTTWGGTVPNKSIRWAYDQLIEASERTDRVCFYFSDFVLSDPDDYSEKNLENYKVIENMIKDGIRVFAGISPLAYNEVFRSFSLEAINRLKKLGIPLIDTYIPSQFLSKALSFLDEY